MKDNQQSQDLYSTQQSTQQNFLSKVKSFWTENKLIIILITVLTLISFGSTTFILIANKKESAPSLQQTPIQLTAPTVPPFKEVVLPTKTPTPTPVPNLVVSQQTATWSAFLSEKYKYSLKYPTDWTATTSAQQDPKILEYVVFNPKDATPSGTLSITLSYGTRTYQEALGLDPQTGETITVASVSATKKNKLDSGGNKAISVIIPTGVNTIIINAKEKYKSILDKMLATIKLTQ